MSIVTGDRYLERLFKFVEERAEPLLEDTLVLKLNPVGLHYVQTRLEAFAELDQLLAGAPVDYLRAYVSDLVDHRALEQLRRILRLLTSLKVVSALPGDVRDPAPLSLLPFGRLRVLELRRCDLSTSAARGLLELKHTLEKIICHDSTDALRHVFASRIEDVKHSPLWNRLQFVSCACNGLVLMDESLQLLSAVETLDLSRNKFAKVDNLRKCSQLKFLDLGFNRLRSVASLNEVSSFIVKLVLRNNALTTLHGIEKLKSLEGLDISYNIISNFSETEMLAGLPHLQNLWLEGNPICCARWYRSQVFSLFTDPDRLILDEKKISTSEFLKRQIIIASRRKRPASFGFYTPAQDGANGTGSGNNKKKKFSRLALIVGGEQSIFSDHESVSCDNDIHSREDDVISSDGTEIDDLMNKAEVMKKERSILWLREFKEWMDITSENTGERNTYNGSPLCPGRDDHESKAREMHPGESSRYLSDSVRASGDESSTNVLESDNSFGDTSINQHASQTFDRIGETGPKFMDSRNKNPTLNSLEGVDYTLLKGKRLDPYTANFQRSEKTVTSSSSTSVTGLTANDSKMESRSSSFGPGSPPQYQEDILHRRHNLVEEILQLSAKSFSVVSSDSNTSSSVDDISEDGSSGTDFDPLLDGECSNMLSDKNTTKSHTEDNSFDRSAEVSLSDHSVMKSKKKQKRRVISLPEEIIIHDNGSLSKNSGNQDVCTDDLDERLGEHSNDKADVEDINNRNDAQGLS